MKKFFVLLGVALVACSLALLPATAQTVQGVVTGTVFDASGAVVPNASAKLTNDATQVSQTATTGSDGIFRFPLVPPGAYTLNVKASGFTEKQIKGIRVDPSQTVPVQVNLAVASATETVEVVAQENLVQTATADLITTIQRSTLENTALISRNVFDLAFLAPTVTQGMDLKPSSGGARQAGTAYMLNGSDNNDNFSAGGINVQPPLESVAEFSILTNQMSAQYGRGAGAVVSASQVSGTNVFHGSLWEFNRNRSFNSSDFFQNRQGSPKPKYIRNQYGGGIGGPVVKNKTFFSFYFDRQDIRTGSDIDSMVPTPTELANMTAAAGSFAKQLLSAYPLKTSSAPCPNQAAEAPDSIGHIGCFKTFNPVTTGINSYYGRIDHNFSMKDRITFSANITRGKTVDTYGGGNPTTATPIPYNDNENYHNLTLTETHVFGPKLVNELTIAHNRHASISLEGSGNFTMPEIGIDGTDYGYGFSFGPYHGYAVNAFTQDRWQVQDNFGITVGKHNLKLGFGYQYGILYRNWDLGGPGYYEFGTVFGKTAQQLGVLNPDGTISGIGDSTDSNFVKDVPYFMEMAIDPRSGAKADAYRHYAMKDAYWFVQDDWKVTRRLTLNLGLRWDRYGAPYEVNGKLAQFTNLNGYDVQAITNARVNPVSSMWKTRNKDYAPRIGFAYDVFGDGKTSLRGGYGISYDRIFDNVWSNGAWNPPFYALIDLDASGSDKIYYSLPISTGAAYTPNSIPRPGVPVSVRTMDVNMKDSSVQNFFLGLERQVGKDFLMRLSYQGSMGRHLPVLMNLNRYDGARYDLATLNSKSRPNPLYTGFNYRANNVTSHYSGMMVEFQKRMSRGLEFQWSYTWSKLMDYGSELFSGETTQGSYSQPYYFVSNNHLEFERGPGAFDHTHNYKIHIRYELPFFKQQKSFFGHALGGWNLTAFYQGYSGHPLEVYNGRSRYKGNAKDSLGNLENIGGDYNLDAVYTDRPVYLGGSASAAYSGWSPADGIFKDLHKIDCGFAGMASTNLTACRNNYAIGTPSTLWANPSGNGIKFGSLGRNVFRGPWFNDLGAAILKNFKATEKITVQFRGEALNLLNHPNFDGITTDVNSSSFGRAHLLVGSAPSRILQLGARVTF